MVFQSSGPISFTKATLSYPVYSVDFDPYNRGYVTVAGGGGEGRSGIGNKITVLDTTSRDKLEPVAEIELSRGEDSVTTIANLASRDGLVTLAGINSSESDQKSGKNEHLRTFEIKYPKRKRRGQAGEEEKDASTSQGTISFAGKAALFKPDTRTKPESYQRLLRLSPAHKRDSGNRRIGAVATGLAAESEVVVFDATKTPSSQSEIISRIPMRSNAEAADLDIIEAEDDTFSLAWCTDYEVYEQTIVHNFATGKSEFAPPNPRKIHSVPMREGADKPLRSKYRSIRFLTEEDVLVLANLPGRTGVELTVLHLYPSGPAMILLHKVLPSHIKQAVALDVCILDQDEHGSRQIVVAVASQDISIWVATLNYSGITRTFSPFRRFTTLRDVHPLQMTALRFSPFHSPPRASPPVLTATGEVAPGSPPPAHPQPQYIKLCSVSMGNTVVLETMALSPLNPKSRSSRYVLSSPSDERYLRNIYIFFGAFMALIAAILIQGLLYPSSTSFIDTISLPSSLKNFVAGHFSAVPPSANIPATSSAISKAPHRLADLLHLSSADSKKALLISDGPSSDVSVEVIASKEEVPHARHWHELAEHEKEAWRQRLVDAGRWSVDEGERVLKGVLFSSWAGFVGQVAGEVVREL